MNTRFLALSALVFSSAFTLAVTANAQNAGGSPPPAQVAVPTVNLPANVADIVKLAKEGLSEDIMLSQVKGAGGASLSVDQILYLNSQGVPQSVIKAIIASAPAGTGPVPTVAQTPAQAPGAVASALPVQGPFSGGPAIPPPIAPRIVTINFPSNVLWFDTGLIVGPGEQVSLQASGTINASTVLGFVKMPSGPDGQPALGVGPSVPGLPIGALIGKIGNEDAFLIGQNATVGSTNGGHLYLAANSLMSVFNKGTWQVVASIGGGAPMVASAPPAQVDLAYFQQQLAPYGNWITTANGVVWVPTVASQVPGWRPYADEGTWQYTDQGMYWQSAYPWGDVAFHYGRWYREAGYGWVWAPGYDWGPSWVAWRHGEAEGFTGWAPLPPAAEFRVGAGLFWGGQVALDVDFGLGVDDFVFIGADHFWEHDYRAYWYPRDRYGYYYGHGVIRNGYRYEGGRFYNEGLGRDRWGAFTHHEMRAERAEDFRRRDEREHFDTRHGEVVRHEEVRRVEARGAPGGRPGGYAQPAKAQPAKAQAKAAAPAKDPKKDK